MKRLSRLVVASSFDEQLNALMYFERKKQYGIELTEKILQCVDRSQARQLIEQAQQETFQMEGYYKLDIDDAIVAAMRDPRWNMLMNSVQKTFEKYMMSQGIWW